MGTENEATKKFKGIQVECEKADGEKIFRSLEPKEGFKIIQVHFYGETEEGRTEPRITFTPKGIFIPAQEKIHIEQIATGGIFVSIEGQEEIE